MALYVKFAQEKRPRTVRGFLKKFYSYQVDPYYAKGHDTYKDALCQRLQCNRGYRSFDDLHELVKTYYPSIDEKKMMHYLLTTKIPLMGKDLYAKPHISHCGEMNRLRYIPYHRAELAEIDRKMSASRYTWRQLLAPLGVTDQASFKEYIKNSK